MTIKEAKSIASNKIGYIEADILLEYILKVNKQFLVINFDKKIGKNEEKIFYKCLNRLKNGEPIQYIVSKANFMGMEFLVNKDVLIPQPDTEVLVEETLKILDLVKEKNLKILDLCTGSGCIAISLAKYAKNVDIYASDISKKALEVAKENSKNLVNGQVKFIKSNMFNNIKDKFDIIVSNPPYIKSNYIKKLDVQVQNEPKIALDGGEDGLEFYKVIRNNIDNFLNTNGVLLMEIGFDQGKQVQEIFENSQCIKDLANNDRVIIWRK